MIIKLEKIISCTSEDPSYPASNLLQQRTNLSWRCAKPGELLASVIFQLREPSCITGMDIGNYRSCIVVVEGSTSAEPDNWVPIINHQFMTHDEAINGKFRDQVQLFTKKELNADTLKIKFDRVKVTCMQSANLREVFGISFIILRTEVVVDVGVDVFARFKLNNTQQSNVDNLKDRYTKLFTNKRTNYKDDLAEKIKQEGANKFAKRQEKAKANENEKFQENSDKNCNEKSFDSENKKKNENLKNSTTSEKNENLKNSTTSEKNENSKNSTTSEKNENSKNSTTSEKNENSKNSTPVARTPFGDVITKNCNNPTPGTSKNMKKRSLFYDDSSDENEKPSKDKNRCSECAKNSQDRLCKKCKLLPLQKKVNVVTPPKKKIKVTKPTKEFTKLFEDVKFALSGYQNPERDEIRRKALKMGGKYIANPDTTNNKCTHLICAFKNTPKSQQLKGHTKIVSHKFITDCYDKKTRLPWRRFALNKKEKDESESEEEIEAGAGPAISSPDPYEQDTDSDSNY